MKSVLKYFLADVLFLGVVLDLDRCIFLWDVFYLGYHLRLESSCIWVNVVHLIISEVHRIRKNLIKMLFNFCSGGF